MDYLFRYLASKFVKQDAPAVEATASAPATEEIQRVAEVVASAQKIEVVDDRRTTPRNGTNNGHKNGNASTSSSTTGNGNYSFIARTDAPTCPECGSIMIPNGSCHKCVNCGTTSGCS
jgi:ribonucleoside-diphosphate reductase alpha chain